MSNSIQDARLRELTFLSELERGPVATPTEMLRKDGPYKSMVVQLLQDGCVNGLDTVPGGGQSGGQVAAEYEDRMWGDIAQALSYQEVRLHVSHKGRVRRSELEQALRTGRDREPFGILWDARYREQAAIMAVLKASPGSPVSFAYIDMNGLKPINDNHGHHAGDEAIKLYLQVVDMMKGESAEGFRGQTADEVLVIMPATTSSDACHRMRAMLKQLHKEHLRSDGTELPLTLTAACGVVSTTDANADAVDLVKKADFQEQRAKEASHKAHANGFPASFLAVEGAQPEEIGAISTWELVEKTA